MSRRTHIHTGYVIPLGLLCALSCCSVGRAADRITSSVDVKSKAKLNGAERRSISLAGSRILRHVDQARDAIAKNDKAAALENVDKGLTLVGIIEKAAPMYRVKVDIKAGDQVYHDEDNVRPYYVWLYDELDKVDLVGPLVRARSERAKKKPPGEVVKSTDLEFTAIKLDLALARSAMETAKKDLNEGKLQEAGAALRTIQTGVIFEFDAVDLPLTRAADNLKLAEYALSDGYTNEAEAALRSASAALKEYEKGAGEAHSKEAQKLHKEIDQLTMSLHQNPEHAKSTISGWWDRVVDWFRRTL
jgi:hypothetical protein